LNITNWSPSQLTHSTAGQRSTPYQQCEVCWSTGPYENITEVDFLCLVSKMQNDIKYLDRLTTMHTLPWSTESANDFREQFNGQWSRTERKCLSLGAQNARSIIQSTYHNRRTHVDFLSTESVVRLRASCVKQRQLNVQNLPLGVMTWFRAQLLHATVARETTSLHKHNFSSSRHSVAYTW